MLIFWLILGWAAVAAIMSQYVYARGIKGIRNKENLAFALILFVFSALVFFAACRSYVSDTGAYVNFYRDIPTDISQLFSYMKSMKKDTFFWGVSMVFKCFVSEDFHVWFGIIAIICCVCIAKVLAKYSVMPFLSAFMFLLTCNFTWLFNGMRQFLAVCIVFVGFRYIEEERFMRYLLLCIIASLMHITALICIPVYFVVKGNGNNKKMFLAMAVTGVIITQLPSLLPAFEAALVETEYSEAISQFASDDGVNRIRILIHAVPLLLFYFLKRNYMNDIPRYVHIAVNMCVFTVLVTVLGTYTSGIYVGRMTIYFEMYALVLYPWIFRNLLSHRNRAIIMPMYIVLYFAYFYYQMVITWDGFGYVSDILNLYYR